VAVPAPGADQGTRHDADRPAEQPNHRTSIGSGGRTANLTVRLSRSAVSQDTDTQNTDR
jgi:hypothetical protein